MAHPNIHLLQFKDHVDYLNSFVKPKDIMYIRNRPAIRKLISLGYQTAGAAPYDEAEFQKRVIFAEDSLKTQVIDRVFSAYMSPNSTDPVLLEYKKREIPIYTKMLATIVFTTFVNHQGSEISGYLDLGMSWANTRRRAIRHTHWPAVYEGRDRLVPMPHHLSYFNRRTNTLNYTDSDNFKVIHHDHYGLVFLHKGDHNFIPVGNIKKYPISISKNVTRSIAISHKQGTVVFYDHIIRKKV